MKVGILLAGHAPDVVLNSLGDYDVMFSRVLDGHGFEFPSWHVVDGVFPDGPEDADAWLITGSKHGAYEDHAWIPPLEDLIRAIHTTEKPLVGICFGHQIIAQALGGKVEKFRGGWSIGRQVYSYMGRPMSVNAWHQDQVVKAPEGAQIVASSDFCANAGFVIGKRVFTIQPHPEFGDPMVRALLDHRAPGVVPDALIKTATAQLDKPTDRHDIVADMAAFLKGEGPHG